MSRAAFVSTLALALFACSAGSNRAIAEPTKKAAPSAAERDRPLVPYALDADADVVRA